LLDEAVMEVPVDHPVSLVRELHELVLDLVASIVAPAKQLLKLSPSMNVKENFI
jgi:hypothetical protein